MASPDILDLAVLLSPITDELPTGADVRKDLSPLSQYQTIKSARAAARAAERKGMHDGDTTEADEHWRKIISIAPNILADQSKDLEVACWLSEALIRRDGFHGLRDSFKLIHGLLENHWNELYPAPDEDGIETRTAPLSGLNGEGAEGVLIAPIRKVPITEGHSSVSFSFWQYQQALDIQRITDEDLRRSRVEKLGFSLEDIEKAVDESSSKFFVDLLDDITDAINLYKNISVQLEQYCYPHEAPPTRNIISILEECRGAINHIAKHKLPVATTVTFVDVTTNSESSTMTAVHTAPQALTDISNRTTALIQLQEIANFFRKTEPHSPISYVIEKAIKWGSMPLNELIIELIPDSSSRERFSELTGVKNED